jgi:hypothetical protein
MLKTRKPTGKPPWPIVLIAGIEKAGKSYSCAEASASPHIGRTFWIGIGEDDPDEYGAIPGARFEIVEHDGSHQQILDSIKAAAAEPHEPGRPNMIVVDSVSNYWDLIEDDLQRIADGRERNRGQITMDLWNKGKQRWRSMMDALRTHKGPVLLTARMDQVTVMRNGKPTHDKQWKIQAHKTLPFDVGIIVQMTARGQAEITGARSLRHDVPLGERRAFPNFTVPALWDAFGYTEPDGTADRQHTGTTVTATPDDDAQQSLDVASPTDWQAEIAKATSADDLRDLWKRAQRENAGQPVLDQITQAASAAQPQTQGA